MTFAPVGFTEIDLSKPVGERRTVRPPTVEEIAAQQAHYDAAQAKIIQDGVDLRLRNEAREGLRAGTPLTRDQVRALYGDDEIAKTG